MNSPWLFTQNSTPRSVCQHEQITLANDDGPTLCCRSCGKRWTFVPAGETPRYIADDDPTFPGMLDNRGWSRSARVTIAEDLGPKASPTQEVSARHAQSTMRVTIKGPKADEATTLARAVLEMLQEADVACSMPEETENPYDGDSIEQLWHLRSSTGLHVIVQTGVVP